MSVPRIARESGSRRDIKIGTIGSKSNISYRWMKVSATSHNSVGESETKESRLSFIPKRCYSVVKTIDQYFQVIFFCGERKYLPNVRKAEDMHLLPFILIAVK